MTLANMDRGCTTEQLPASAQCAQTQGITEQGITEKVDQFLVCQQPPLPCIIVDLDVVRAKYYALRTCFPKAKVFYAVKANPAADVLATLASAGANFDLASEGEIERVRSLGISADRLSFGNTIKRETEIKRAHRHGVNLFAFDSIGELEKIARAAPGAQIFCRLLVGGTGADWPLTRKFGCDAEMAADLIGHARTLGLRPKGVSFHVGSQQTRPLLWETAIAAAAGVFQTCAARGVDLSLLNVGGGLPAQYRTPLPALAAYADVIETSLRTHFGEARPEIFIEPGRYLVGDAGVLRSEVLLIARKSRRASRRWVYLDAGRYNGLPETLGERIHYRIRAPHTGGPRAPVILAGPTCDSTDIIYEHAGYELPLDLAAGDPIDFLSAGAYTASYASVEFNGFSPIRTYCI